MAATGVDVVSLDWTVDMAEGRARVQQGRQEWIRRRQNNNNVALVLDPNDRGAVQGNLDPAILLGPQDTIRERTLEILQQAGPTGHVMNLGHGIEAETTEDNARLFIETVRNYRHAAAA
jgi:uroporphyrinogen decarboxylase